MSAADDLARLRNDVDTALDRLIGHLAATTVSAEVWRTQRAEYLAWVQRERDRAQAIIAASRTGIRAITDGMYLKDGDVDTDLLAADAAAIQRALAQAKRAAETPAAAAPTITPVTTTTTTTTTEDPK